MGTMDISDSVNAGINRDLKTAAMKDLGIAAKPGVGTGQTFVPDLGSISDQQYKDWAAKNADKVKKITSDYWKKTMQDIFGVAPTDTSRDGKNTGSGDGAKLDLSWANDLVQKLKLVKEGSLNALKPLESLQKFLGKGNKDTRNPMLENQIGKLKELEKQASTSGVSLATNLVELLKSLDAEQFNLVYKYLFNIDGTLNDIGKIYNEAFKVETIASYLQSQKESNDVLDAQVNTFNKLVKAGYSTDKIMKILESDTLAIDLAMGGAFSPEEQEQFNAELKQTRDLNAQISMQNMMKQLPGLQDQVSVLNKLTSSGYEYSDALSIIKDKSLVAAIALEPDPTKWKSLVDNAVGFADVLSMIDEMNKTPQQRVQDDINRSIAALDLEARTLQNNFDKANYQLQLDITAKQGTIEKLNDSIQAEQDKIDSLNIKLKYDKEIGQNTIDDIQETISDIQRTIETDYDRPLQALSDRSNILSNDLTLIDKAAEAINEKYDKQEEALSKISQLNQDIATQEKNRISLADALSQGDISAAAQMANEIRSTAASAANRASGDFIAAARKSEVDNLRSASGMTREQIEAEQFAIGQRSFAIEQSRKILQDQIVVIEDKLYNIQEKREAILLTIRGYEENIDKIKNGALLTEEKALGILQGKLDTNQKALDAELARINQKKLDYEATQIALDTWSQKQDIFNKGPLKSASDLTSSIAKNFADIIAAASKDITVKIKAVYEGFQNFATGNTNAREAEIKAAQLAYDTDLKALNALRGIGPSAWNALKDDFDKKYPKGRPMMYGGKVKPMQYGGRVGSDYVPALLTPGEFVMNKTASKAFGPTLAAMNGSKFPSMLGRVGQSSYGSMPSPISTNFITQSYPQMSSTSINPMTTMSSANVNNNSTAVYNYSVGINVGGSNTNPQDIARAVMTEIKNVDAQRIRSQRA
jgi:hypothetical protein